VVAGGSDNGLIYIPEAMSGQFNLTEILKLTFALIRKHDVKKLVVENIAYQEALVQAIEIEKEREDDKGIKVNEDVHFSVVRETPGSKDSKDARIKSMIPYFENGKVLLTKDMKKLEKQLREYPYGKKRDLIDVLAYALRNVIHVKAVEPKKELDPLSWEAVIKELRDKSNNNDYPFAKARKYAANASPSLW
jgi:phage terminase large subunit-like protein